MGLLSDLFGLKTKYVDEELDEAELAAQIEKAKAFFLDPDEAKSLGKNGYRPTPIKNQVPINQGSKQENIEQIQQSSNSNLLPEPQAADHSDQTSSDHSSTDSSMDMFRQMARNIKKY
ncbi:MAG TPA: hypothetical protein V6C90_18545 [Coleofasciculaceae cyanobacterium]|jgi:hypothetical protein